MKRWLAILLLVAQLPAAAIAQSDAASPDPAAEESEEAAAVVVPLREGREKPRSCKVIAKQIAHYETVVEEAKRRKNPLWENATEMQIDNLRMQQFRKCPDDVPPSAMERVAELLKTLGRAALTASTFGAF